MTLKPTVYCLTHVPFEGTGMIKSYLTERGFELQTVRLFEGAPVPPVEEVDYLIVMGGPMDMGDEASYPWLKAEKKLIEEMLGHQKPILGICLGSQLIAHALGKDVYPAREREIGWYPVTLTEAGREHPATRGWKREPMVFHWHRNTFDLPEGAVRLALTEVCSNQAYVYNRSVIGLQFHLEMGRNEIQSMVNNSDDYRKEGPFIQNAESMLAQSGAASETRQMLYDLLDYWIQESEQKQ